MFSNSGGGEIIHISLGPRGNSVTSHLMNLYGLACTSSSVNTGQDSIPLCDPHITHGIHEEIYVPRVLFVDGSDYSPSGFSSYTTNESYSERVVSWDGSLQFQKVPIMSKIYDNKNEQHSLSDYENGFRAKSSTRHDYDASCIFRETANNLANSSRYKVSTYSSNLCSQYIYPTVWENDKGRHITWDDTERVELINDDYDESRLCNKWGTQFSGLQAKMYATWSELSKNRDTKSTMLTHKNEVKTNQSDISGLHEDINPKLIDKGNLSWPEYFLPPKPTNKNCSIPLNFKRGKTLFQYENYAEDRNKLQGSDQDVFFSYNTGYNPLSLQNLHQGIGIISNTWREEVMSEKIRKCIETCDCVQGFQLFIDNEMGLFGGLSHSILEELSEECAKSSKWSILIGDDTSRNDQINKPCYWRTKINAIQTFRSDLNKGLTLRAITNNSDLVLPISLWNCWQALYCSNREENVRSFSSTYTESNIMFHSSAVAALSLEVSTLPYRLIRNCSEHRNKFRTNIELLCNNTHLQDIRYSHINDPSHCTDNLTYNELTLSLRPTNRHIILELSAMFQPVKCNSSSASVAHNLYQKLSEGTSIQRRQLEINKQKNKSIHQHIKSNDIHPGSWMEDIGSSGGLLFPLSHTNISLNNFNNRSLHKNFAISSSLRPSKIDAVKGSEKSITQMMMEGMSVRYKPESCVGTCVNQSFSDLIGTESYGTGSYWKRLLENNNSSSESSIISVISNSTRAYGYLHLVGENFQKCLSQKNRSYMNHDITTGIAPELEEISETLEHCMNLREFYKPPVGIDDKNEEECFDVDE